MKILTIKYSIAIILLSAQILFAQNKTADLFKEVEAHLDLANELQAEILCKEDYELAFQHYNKALLVKNDSYFKPYIRTELNTAISIIQSMNINIDKKTYFFNDILIQRALGKNLEAEKYATEFWNNSENLFIETIEKFDDGKISEAREDLNLVSDSYKKVIARAENANYYVTEWEPLHSANSSLSELLAPDIYSDGMYHFSNALNGIAENDNIEEYFDELLIAEGFFNQAAIFSDKFLENEPDILPAREVAIEAGAQIYAPKLWIEAENSLKEAASEFPVSDFENYHSKTAIALKNYNLAKDFANKERFLATAKNKIELAELSEAEIYSPKTLNSSKIKLNKAINLIDNGSQDFVEVKEIAASASNDADKALKISNLLSSIEKGEMSLEDVILGWKIFDEPEEFTIENPIAPTAKTVNYSSPPVTASTLVGNGYEVVNNENEIIFNLTGIKFPFVGSLLSTSDKQILRNVISEINNYPDYPISITSFTDNIGTEFFNKNLAEERARNIVNYLEEVSDLNSSEINIISAGESEPLEDNRTFEGREKNNRIVITLNKNSD